MLYKKSFKNFICICIFFFWFLFIVMIIDELLGNGWFLVWFNLYWFYDWEIKDEMIVKSCLWFYFIIIIELRFLNVKKNRILC